MNSGQEQYIQFEIREEKYAIHISETHEIIKMQVISEIPNVMPYVKGVINLRGKIIPVICLRKVFGMAEGVYTNHTRIVIVNHNEETVGIVVDRVDKVTTFSDIQPTPDRYAGMNGVDFSGIGIVDEEIIGILRFDQVLLSNTKDHYAQGDRKQP